MARPTAAEVKAFKVHCKTLVNDKEHSRVFQIFTEPDEGGNRWHESVKKLGSKGIVREAAETYINCGLIHHTGDYKTMRLPDTAEEVINYAFLSLGGESDGCNVTTYTRKDWKKKQEEKQRKRCEPVVGEICRKYNVKPNSLAMVAALHKYYKSIVDRERHFRNNDEMRAERYATCVMGGAGSVAFYEDNDYASSQISDANEKLSDALDYLRKYCPLLMARWDEHQAKKKQA